MNWTRHRASVAGAPKGRFDAIREMLAIWGPLALIVAAGFVIAFRYVGAPPPKVIRIATGEADGAYYAFAQQYARLYPEHTDKLILDSVVAADGVAGIVTVQAAGGRAMAAADFLRGHPEVIGKQLKSDAG